MPSKIKPRDRLQRQMVRNYARSLEAVGRGGQVSMANVERAQQNAAAITNYLTQRLEFERRYGHKAVEVKTYLSRALQRSAKFYPFYYLKNLTRKEFLTFCLTQIEYQRIMLKEHEGISFRTSGELLAKEFLTLMDEHENDLRRSAQKQ